MTIAADPSPVRIKPNANERFLLGLPYLADGPLLHAARSLNASVLLSANAFSKYGTVDGFRRWTGFKTHRLWLLAGIDACLDSAGFVAMRNYGRYPWTVEDYMDLCAARPWRWFAAMDMCVEPELFETTEAVVDEDAEMRRTRETVLDRISLTARSLKICRRAAEERGILDRLMPVVQGWKPADYARCLERMPSVETVRILGVGSVCRRPIGGANGVLAVVDRIDRELGSSPAKLHLFGIKGEGAVELNGHPRVESFDSQSYGFRARVLSREGGFSKSNAFLAGVMKDWYERQVRASQKSRSQTAYQTDLDLDCPEPEPHNAFERRLSRAREELRDLVEDGEAPPGWLDEMHALEWVAADDDDESTEADMDETPTCRREMIPA
jgi:hypothetical protein